MVGIGIMDMGGLSWLHFGMVMAAGAVICIIHAGISLSRPSLDKMLTSLLDRRSVGPAFRTGIDRQLHTQSCFSFYNEHYRMSLFITDNWYILISTNASLICNKEEIRDVSRYFHTNHTDYCLKVEFYDGSKFTCLCHTICDDVVAMTKEHIRGISK